MKETEAVLERLANRDSGALVVKLPREPGKRESRYHHLFCGEVDMRLLPRAQTMKRTPLLNTLS